MAQAWREHIEALKRFNLWEVRQLRDQPPDYVRALAWLSEAWELAAKYAPDRDPARSHEERLHRLLRLRAALERARLSP
jgi:hypothetical protein